MPHLLVLLPGKAFRSYTLSLTEQHMYGSSRLGIVNKDLPLVGSLYKPLESTKRNGTNTSQKEYSNQSQYFSFTLTKNEAGKIIKQFKRHRNAKEKKK